MRQLILMRHAKAAPHVEGADKARPLMQRGVNDAARMGRYLVEKKLIPDLVLASTAARAHQTAHHVIDVFGGERRVRLAPHDEFYRAGANELLRAIRQTPRSVRRLLLVGHNPAIAELARRLAQAGGNGAISAMQSRFPTAAAAIFDFNSPDWDSTAAGSADLVAYVTPGSLSGEADLD